MAVNSVNILSPLPTVPVYVRLSFPITGQPDESLKESELESGDPERLSLASAFKAAVPVRAAGATLLAQSRNGDSGGAGLRIPHRSVRTSRDFADGPRRSSCQSPRQK
ncbi:hypothetical protein JZ751_027591 [Albula glossodonta]|uniref:Uncharacterized protein n=1 Tax=Albula glossodonta TaxID=121402 RepID=A0A8T2NEQ0_9TELE|nr:hypothetical protein JZ751_027591 [Albula glossodonta]